ncbi:MAG: TorF family putative porin [Rubrivivax sp.]
MKTFTIAAAAVAVAALSALLVPSVTLAADSSVAFNAGVVTDYRYRGISQTRLKPALQGGVDYTAGAFYLGAWGSTIKWIKDGGGGASAEFDIYGGVKGEITKGLGYDVGLLTYQYPSNGLNPSANTLEVYGAITSGPVTAKYSRSTTNLFGFANSKGSGYLDISATFDVGGFAVTPHIGRQTVKNNGGFSYTDYAVAISKEISGITWSATLVDTGTSAYTGAGKDLGKAGAVLGAKLAF